MWIGEDSAKGYVQADFMETFRRYVPKSEVEEFLERNRRPATPEPAQTEQGQTTKT